ncbi:MAG: hypothetical protein QM764_16155 [Chitinophagaceae bacterium]
MQTAVPEVTDIKEPESIIKLYGPNCLVPDSAANQLFTGEKTSENGVRFCSSLYHQGSDRSWRTCLLELKRSM